MPAGDRCSSFQDEAPNGEQLTAYDRQQCSLYFRLLDAEAGGATWEQIARSIFQLDPAREGERALRVVRGHLARAHWMSKSGFAMLSRSLSFRG